jgi:hypothetical protein
MAVLPLILGAVGAAGSVATGIKSLTSGGGGRPSPYPTPAEIAQNRAQLASSVRQGAGNYQEATGGGASPDYVANMMATSTGNISNLSEIQDLLRQFAPGVGAGGGFGGGGTNFADLAAPTQTTQTLSGGSGLTEGSVFG